MPAGHEELEALVRHLADRVAAVEKRLGMDAVVHHAVPPVAPQMALIEVPHPLAPPTAPPVAPPIAPPVDPVHIDVSDAEVDSAAGTPGAGTPDRSVRLDELVRARQTLREAQDAVRLEADHAAAARMARAREHALAGAGAPPVAPTAPARKKAEAWNIERLIGGRLFAILGALLVVIAVALFLKLAVERGWFVPSPAMRCLMVGAFGVLLLGAGEWALRKINALASSGLTAAGVAVLYAAAYATYGWYEIVPQSAAFVMLTAVSAVGVFVSLRSRSVAVASLAMVGAYINPVLLAGKSTSPLVLPAYLLLLLVSGLLLAAWRPNPFRALRTVAWWGTVLVGTAWIVGDGHAYPLLVLAFLGAVWAVVHAELFVGARRAVEATITPGNTGSLSVRLARPMMMSFATTAWCGTAGVLVVQAFRGPLAFEPWMAPAALAVAAMSLALVLCGNLRVLRDPPETDAERLGVALWMQAGALIIATVALGLSDWTQVVAWLAMGVAAVAAAKWARLGRLDLYGLTVLVIAVVRLVVYDSWHAAAMAGPGMRVKALGLAPTAWSVLMAAGGAAWLGAAWLMWRPDASRRRVAAVNSAIAVGLTGALGGLFTQNAEAAAMGGVAVVLGAAVLAAGAWRRSAGLVVYGCLVLLGTSLIALQLQLGVFGASRAVGSVGPVLISTWGITLAMGAAAWVFAAWVLERRSSAGWHGASIAACAAAAASLLAATIVPGTSVRWLCAVWMVIGLGVVLAHRRFGRHALDVIGLSVLALNIWMWAMGFLGYGEYFKEDASAFRHPGLWVGLMITGSLVGSSAWLLKSKRATARAVPWTASGLAAAFALVCTSLEVARSARILVPGDATAQAAAVSVWWGLFGVGLIVLGFLVRVAPVRHAGLALMCVAVGKALLFDLAEVAPEWRVASMLGLGLLILGVALAYFKVSARLATHEPPEAGGSEQGGGAQ